MKHQRARWIVTTLLIAMVIPAGAFALDHGRVTLPVVDRADALPHRAPASSSSPRTVPPSPRYNPHADARRFIALINASRRARGLPALRIRGDLTAIAARWSARMAARRRISHNPRFPYQIHGWELLGENVGWTRGSVDHLHAAFLASPKHRKNILDPRFTSIGVAEMVSNDGRIFVTEDFGWF